MKKTLFFTTLLISIMLLAQIETPQKPYNVFSILEQAPLHENLVSELQKAIKNGDNEMMLTITKRGSKLFPEDQTWHYNNACALSKAKKYDEALSELLIAVETGFNDPEIIANDKDFNPVKERKEFKEIVKKAEYYAKNPDKLQNPKITYKVTDTALPITRTNTIWNFQTREFIVLSQFPKEKSPIFTLEGEAGDLIRKWQKEGTAAGNLGDIYDNTDDNHSVLEVSKFPGMVRTFYSNEAKEANIGTLGPTPFRFGQHAVIGNCSKALIGGPAWHSMAREVTTPQKLPYLMSQYLGSAIYVYPQHNDYLNSIQGDVFVCRTPFFFTAPASSWSDIPILNAIATALAALRPEVKEKLLASQTLSPTIQYIIRMSLCDTREDYLTYKAHPVVFNGDKINLTNVANLAHEIETNSIPPIASIYLLNDSGKDYKQGRDFFDILPSENNFTLPFAISRIFRGMDFVRKYHLAAKATSPNAKFHWVLLQGNPESVRITPLSDSGNEVEIEIDYQGPIFNTPYGLRSSRLDIALIVDDGTHYSPPAFFSCFFLPNETRSYSSDKRILAVNYASSTNYVDPTISIKKTWRDLYKYDKSQNKNGWTRIMDPSKRTESYTESGQIILAPATKNLPAETETPKYKIIQSPDGQLLLTL